MHNSRFDNMYENIILQVLDNEIDKNQYKSH